MANESLKKIHKNRILIKKTFDTFSMGICFFKSNGLPVLCNKKMHSLSYELTGNDVKSLYELEDAISNPDKYGEVIKEKDVLIFKDKSAWKFKKETVQDGYGTNYIQLVASDVTKLKKKQQLLTEETKQIKKLSRELQKVSAGIITETREQEILAMKMRVHDEIGICLLTAQQILKENKPIKSADIIVEKWKNLIGLFAEEGNNKNSEDKQLEIIKKLGMDMGIIIRIYGEMPKNKEKEYHLISGIRVCATNAVRHANANLMEVNVLHENGYIKMTVTNNGVPPKEPIKEGGGLASLRKKIEKIGGVLEIESEPLFKMVVIIPD